MFFEALNRITSTCVGILHVVKDFIEIFAAQGLEYLLLTGD